MDGLPLPVNLGIGGLLSLTIILILLGKLVPWLFYNREVERNETLSKTNENLSEALKALTEQVQKVYEGNSVIIKALQDGQVRRKTPS